MVVCDVSGSMDGEPMEVAIALSLLLTEAAPQDCPWRGHIFTFDEKPRCVSYLNCYAEFAKKQKRLAYRFTKQSHRTCVFNVHRDKF